MMEAGLWGRGQQKSRGQFLTEYNLRWTLSDADDNSFSLGACAARAGIPLRELPIEANLGYKSGAYPDLDSNRVKNGYSWGLKAYGEAGALSQTPLPSVTPKGWIYEKVNTVVDTVISLF